MVSMKFYDRLKGENSVEFFRPDKNGLLTIVAIGDKIKLSLDEVSKLHNWLQNRISEMPVAKIEDALSSVI